MPDRMSVTYTVMAQCEVDMDKRVVKTKRTIKRTLVELLATMPFEKITVTEMCRAADVRRITF